MSTEEVIRPDSFAVAVSGLPEDAVDEDEIAKFFEENALFGSRPASIVKVVIGFNVGQYYEYARRQSYLQKKLRRTGKPQDLVGLTLCMVNHAYSTFLTIRKSTGAQEIRFVDKLSLTKRALHCISSKCPPQFVILR
ncbi:putative GTP-binding TypA, related protein [Toxoplasma gondii FOU]|uniref:Putative GTP-binding TypA, related protein n=1 Tax=Toxoplasma gondii FOU TaxID=943167 RepID=A0A086JSS6_TOXGO|nr:putative GTP-binding TypA, related protein [Toxoplasma gondii FOU]